jgi:hypothetical protein
MVLLCLSIMIYSLDIQCRKKQSPIVNQKSAQSRGKFTSFHIISVQYLLIILRVETYKVTRRQKGIQVLGGA